MSKYCCWTCFIKYDHGCTQRCKDIWCHQIWEYGNKRQVNAHMEIDRIWNSNKQTTTEELRRTFERRYPHLKKYWSSPSPSPSPSSSSPSPSPSSSSFFSSSFSSSSSPSSSGQSSSSPSPSSSSSSSSSEMVGLKKKLRELENSSKKKEEEIVSLKRRYSQLEIEKSQVINNNQTLSENLQETQRRMRKLETENTMLSQNLGDVKRRYSQLESEKSEVSNQNGTLSQRLRDVERRYSQLESEKSQVSNNNRTLSENLQEIQTQNRRLETEKSEVSNQNRTLSQRLRDVERRNSQLESEKLEAEQNTQDITKALQTSQEENRRLEEVIRRLQGSSSVVEKRFSQTKYYELYGSTEPPRYTFDVFGAVQTFIKMFAKLKGISDEELHRFIGALHRETTILGGVDELIGEVGTIAIRLWTSAQTLQNRELCSIFNEAIREDYEEMMPAVVVFAKGLNMLCITRRMVPSQIRFAEKTYRGGALPQQHHSFFEVGKQFRTPQFLSTSKNQRVAYDFARKASERGEEPVLWEFVFNPILGCDHVNFLERPNVEGEEEFLFTGYSVFKVLSREFKSQPRWTDPHKIVLEVAPDNRDFPEDLPLSPWS